MRRKLGETAQIQLGWTHTRIKQATTPQTRPRISNDLRLQRWRRLKILAKRMIKTNRSYSNNRRMLRRSAVGNSNHLSYSTSLSKVMWLKRSNEWPILRHLLPQHRQHSRKTSVSDAFLATIRRWLRIQICIPMPPNRAAQAATHLLSLALRSAVSVGLGTKSQTVTGQELSSGLSPNRRATSHSNYRASSAL